MSATNRKRADGKAYVRDPNDDFPTPAWAVERLLDVEGANLQEVGSRWLEPCAGRGNIIRAVNAWIEDSPHVGTTRDKPSWTAVELQAKYARALAAVAAGAIADFRVWAATRPDASFDVAITNPPYGLAEEVLDVLQRIARVVVMLTRVGFLGSDERCDRHRLWMPDVNILPNRPQFVGGNQDNAEYAWLVWWGDREREDVREHRLSTAKTRVLASTPLIIRKAQRPEVAA